MTFYIKQDDTSPELQATLKDADGTAIDLTGATVRFHMRQSGSTTAKVDAAATVVTAASGIVKYTWSAADTDTEGRFEGEFEVTYADGSIETVPNTGYIPIRIRGDIA